MAKFGELRLKCEANACSSTVNTTVVQQHFLLERKIGIRTWLTSLVTIIKILRRKLRLSLSFSIVLSIVCERSIN